MPPNEARTRRELIDPALLRAGWDVGDPRQVGIEVPVDGEGAEPWNGVTDYCLYRPDGQVLAVVEAKKQARDPNVAREQTRLYVADIAARRTTGVPQTFTPFAFFTNGLDTYFWDVEAASPRLVAGFFSPADLDNLLFLRQNARPLAQMPISGAIAGRLYQQEAIRRVVEAFDAGRRRALLVMATGTGKTRTTVALVDLFLRANQARRILFLADRDALVDQALKDGFKTFLPDEPRHRIWTHDVDPSKRLYVATLHTMNRCFNQFSPGFFDLIIFDEAHRSVYNRLGEVMNYFDGRMIGLTATPADFLERDTFRLFGCDDKTPTFLYPYKQAVDEKYLVDFSLYQAQTGFQRRGIKGADLDEESRNALMEQGLDPDELDYSGTQIEKDVTNKDTLRRQWDEFMDICLKDESGQLPGKSIVFAMTQAHAERLRGVFEEMYPHYRNMVQVITSDTERVRDGSYGDGLLTQFKKNDLPRIAISVDMLDTGVDVPEVVNLAFMKPVQSRIKLWQMIGRGTRSDEACTHKDRLPGGRKTEFKVIDFWQNDFERQAGDREASAVPVLVTVFNTRLKILSAALAAQNGPEGQQSKADLRAMLALIPQDAFPVKRVWPQIERAWGDPFWSYLTLATLEFLRTQVGPLLRLAGDVDVAAWTFTSKMERLRLQILIGKEDAASRQSIAEDVSRLPAFVHENPAVQPAIKLCVASTLGKSSLPALREAVDTLAPLMKLRTERPVSLLALDLQDIIEGRGYVTLSEGGERVYVAEYRTRVEQRIQEIAGVHPTVRAIAEGRPVSDFDLVALERTLREGLGGSHVDLTTQNIRKAYGLHLTSFLAFLRHILALEGLPDYDAVVSHAFETRLAAHPYNADQIRFLRVVQEVFLRQRGLSRADLYDAPALKRLGQEAADRFFSQPEIDDLLDFTRRLQLAA